MTSDPTRRLPEGDPVSSLDHTWTELAERANDGLEVTLLWSRSSGRVKVAISDSRLDDRFELDVAGADALAAFYHPFAYAASGATRPDRVTGATTELQLQS
jgi:hypothetical protein